VGGVTLTTALRTPIGESVEAQISQERIVILGASLPKESWEPLLDELKAEHVPSLMQQGKRSSVVVGPTGRVDAFIYRTTPMPDEEVVRILGKHGIRATTV